MESIVHRALLVSTIVGTAVPAQTGLAGAADNAAPARLAALVEQSERSGARTGVAVFELGDGGAADALFGHREGEPFVPASNQKLLTAAACLARLGVDYRFRTVFRLRDGWLEVTAGGDPNWATGDADDPVVIFARVARRLAAAGVRAVRGVRLVAGPFRGPARPPGWPSDQLDRAYCAPTGGLVFDRGCYRVAIESAAGAAHASLDVLAPPAGLSLAGSLPLTDDRRRGSRYGFVQVGDRLRARGHFLRGAPRRVVEGALRGDPATFFQASLEHVLRGAGIDCDAAARPTDRELEVYVHETTLRDALVPMLSDSSNFHAEQCLRVLGAETVGDGSFAGGCRALRAEIERLVGPLPDVVKVADGSGLSRGNALTPTVLADLLRVAPGTAWGAVLVDSLAHGGIDGTLRRRFTDDALKGRVRAKTGTLSGVRALSGYVRPPGSERLRGFVILMNQAEPARRRRGGPSLRELQDRMVAAIAGRGG